MVGRWLEDLGGLPIRWSLVFPVAGFLKSCLHCLGHITWASLPMSSDSFFSGKMNIAHRGHIHSYYGSCKSDSTSGFLSLKQDFQRKIKMRFSNLCLLQRFLFWSGFSNWRRPLDVRLLVRGNIQIINNQHQLNGLFNRERPRTSWQTDGGKVETVTDFLLLGSKITADSDCSHEKRCLLLGRKGLTNLESIVKDRDITLLTKVHRVKVMVLPVVMYGCESWTAEKAECQRTDVFKLWC